MRLAVIQLDGLDAAQVIMISGESGVSCQWGECRFCHEFVCLVVEAIVDVVAQEAVNEGCLCVVIVAKRCSTLSSQEMSIGAQLLNSRETKKRDKALTIVRRQVLR